MIEDFTDEYRRYKVIGQKALDQLSEPDINRTIGHGNNSVAVIVRHLSGNLVSRFTDFLDADGEKPWRDRDAEFEDAEYSRAEVQQLWDRGWEVLEGTLGSLSEADLERRVTIRIAGWLRAIRLDAHCFYPRKGMNLEAHYFSMNLR